MAYLYGYDTCQMSAEDARERGGGRGQREPTRVVEEREMKDG